MRPRELVPPKCPACGAPKRRRSATKLNGWRCDPCARKYLAARYAAQERVLVPAVLNGGARHPEHEAEIARRVEAYARAWDGLVALFGSPSRVEKWVPSLSRIAG